MLQVSKVGKAQSVSILDVIHMLALARPSVKATAIAICFSKAFSHRKDSDSHMHLDCLGDCHTAKNHWGRV